MTDTPLTMTADTIDAKYWSLSNIQAQLLTPPRSLLAKAYYKTEKVNNKDLPISRVSTVEIFLCSR